MAVTNTVGGGVPDAPCFGGAASGGILFASSGKKCAKNADKTKVLESFSVDKWGFSRTRPKCSIGFRSAQRRYYI